MSSQLKLNIFIAFLAIFAQDVAMAHQCYICGADWNLSCDKFDPSNKTFIKDCPEAKACIIQTQTHVGTILARSCENRRLQDCQIANNIQYCYCSKDLCNENKFTPSPSDDEDFPSEGSGDNVISINDIKNIKTNVTSNTSRFYINSTFITLGALFYSITQLRLD